MFFFFNDTATTEIYTLSLHDALPIFEALKKRVVVEVILPHVQPSQVRVSLKGHPEHVVGLPLDRKSTRLNSSHANISYAVFCLKKKKNKKNQLINQRYN